MKQEIVPVERAILSYFDKSGLPDIATALHSLGIELFASGGTAGMIRKHGLPVTDSEKYTGWPAMFDHRVATLHPKIHGGILYRRGHEGDEADAEKYGIKSLDLVMVDPYNVVSAIEETGTVDAVIGAIDVGGPTMIRGAAKNFAHVGAVIDREDDLHVVEEIKKKGGLTYSTRLGLSAKVFEFMGEYDAAIGKFLREQHASLK